MIECEELRAVSPQDAQDLFALLKDFSHVNSREELQANLQQIIASLQSAFFVLRIDGQIVGCCTVNLQYKTSRCEAHLDDVVVSPAQRGKGLGKQICAFAIGWAHDAGAVCIELTSRQSRIEANHLYQKLGFTQRETNIYRLML